MLNAFRNGFQMVIYIGHSVTVFIVKQTKLITNNTDKFNFRFVRASIFFLIRARCEAQAGKITRNTRRIVSFVQKKHHWRRIRSPKLFSIFTIFFQSLKTNFYPFTILFW